MWTTTLFAITVCLGSITIRSGDCMSEPGGPCYEGTESGDCITLNLCRPIQIAIAQKKTSISKVTCRVDGFTALPYVCCPNGRAPKPRNPDTITIAKDAPPGSRISVQKCYDYAKGVYQSEMTYALFEGSTKVDKCVKVAEGLIIKGEPTKKGEFPHMALLGYGEDKENLKYNCGGSLVSERFVMTAAHCAMSALPSYVLLGEHEKGTTDDGNDTQLIAVQKFIAHPKYVPPAHYFDIALIRLSTEAKLTPFVRPGCLHSDQNYGKVLIATGWGQLEFLADQHTSDILYKVDLDEVNSTYCQLAHRTNAKLPKGYLPDQQMCVGKLEGGKDTCQGDSGGPLQVFMTEPHCSYLIVGVTSFGKGCALPKTPGVYARVTKFIKWLEDTIWAADGDETSSTSKQPSPTSNKGALVNSPSIDNNTSAANKASATNTVINTPETKTLVKYNSTVRVVIIKDNKVSNYTYNSETTGPNTFTDGNFKFNFTPIAGLLSSLSSQIPLNFSNDGDLKFNLSSIADLLSSLKN